MRIKRPRKLRLHVETLDLFKAGKAGVEGGISGNGCTVLTTCSPDCEGFNGGGRQAPR